jgi:hypothetical protein
MLRSRKADLKRKEANLNALSSALARSEKNLLSKAKNICKKE